jgi:hypothetical protein
MRSVHKNSPAKLAVYQPLLKHIQLPLEDSFFLKQIFLKYF